MTQLKSREEYERWKANRPVPPHQPQHRNLPGPHQPGPSRAGPSGAKAGNPFGDLPRWAWIFVVMCLAIPVITLGGALPGALGAGAAAGCASVAKKHEQSVRARVLICLAITGAAWTGLGILLALLV